MNFKKIFIISFLIIQLFAALGCNAQQLEKVGNTDKGILYIDNDSVKTIKKADQYFLMVAAEEFFTRSEEHTSELQSR